MTLGIVLAGGRGSRLGADRPKALVRLGAGTLLTRALRLLEPRCARVVVCAPAAIAAQLPVTNPVHDPGEGPLAALVAAFAAERFERALVLGVDFPFVRGALLDALLQGLGAHDAVVPVPGGVVQPLVAAYAASAAAPLAAALARGERSLSRALVALDVVRIDGEALDAIDPDAGAAFNLNTPDDLREAERRAGGERAA